MLKANKKNKATHKSILHENRFVSGHTVSYDSSNNLLNKCPTPMVDTGITKADGFVPAALVFSQVIDEGDSLSNHSNRSCHDNHNRYHV